MPTIPHPANHALRRAAFAAAAMTLLTLASPAAAGPFFMGLGDLPGGFFSSHAYAVSADGSTVVGQGLSPSPIYDEAFRWTQADGMVALDSSHPRMPFAVSADGSVVVGYDNNGAFRWTQADGIVNIGDTSIPSYTDSIARAVSADGSVVAGIDYGGLYPQAFRWTQADGMVGLGELPGGQDYSAGAGISADGSVIVGFSQQTLGEEAFRWTQADGMVGLGDLRNDPNYISSAAFAASADGSVIVGESISASGSGREAFRWTQADGMVGLGILPGSVLYDTSARAVSADGSVIVGYGNGLGPFGTGTVSKAFIWDQVHGTRLLKDALTDLGLDLSDWRLYYATGISADGTIIVGAGENLKTGHEEAFMAKIPVATVAEPGTLALLGAGLAGFAAFRRRKAAGHTAL